jgi:hypothetical protein
MTLRSIGLFLLLSASLQLSAQQAKVNVTGPWQEGRFTLTQNGDSVTSEGDLGHANGHFTGPYTFVMSWRNATLIATVTPAADRIDWNHNAPWTRQAPGSKSKEATAPAQ